MKKLMTVMFAALAAVTCCAMSLGDAKGKIKAVIDNPSEATAVIKQLSAADQKAFIAAVNEAIGKLPGSAEDRAAKAVSVNSAALAGVSKENVSAMIAEVFATAPLDSLTAINESFAKDFFSRSSASGRNLDDDRFTNLCAKVVTEVKGRVGGSSDGDVRAGFAALMMARASNGTPASLVDQLAAMLGDSAEIAKTEWFPAALGPSHDYDPMLSATGVNTIPDVPTVLALAGPQRHAELLGAMSSGADPIAATSDGFGDWAHDYPVIDIGINTVPRTTEDLPWNPELPRGYNGQNFGR